MLGGGVEQQADVAAGVRQGGIRLAEHRGPSRRRGRQAGHDAHRRRLAVDDVSFEVKPGLVTGFLGPNGAGKTTAMRVMAGLTPATSGRPTVLGKPYAALPNPGRHVGLLLDASAQHAAAPAARS